GPGTDSAPDGAQRVAGDAQSPLLTSSTITTVTGRIFSPSMATMVSARRRRAALDRAGRRSIGGKLDPTGISGRGWCVVGWFERPEFGANVGLIDEIYRQYLDNPESVSPAWRDFFAENEPEDDGTQTPEDTAEGGVEAEGGQAQQEQAPAPPARQEAPK